MDITTASAIGRLRRLAGLSQRELADRAGTSQPAIARLEQGQTNPSLATLARLAEAAGFQLRLELVPAPRPDPAVEAYKRDVDRTLLRANLGRTIDERLRALDELQRVGTELERGVRVAKRSRPASKRQR